MTGQGFYSLFDIGDMGLRELYGHAHLIPKIMKFILNNSNMLAALYVGWLENPGTLANVEMVGFRNGFHRKEWLHRFVPAKTSILSCNCSVQPIH